MNKILPYLLNDYRDHVVKRSVVRDRTFDLVRGAAVFFMMLVHTLEIYGQPSSINSVAGSVITFFGQMPAAPTFMFLMGLLYLQTSKEGNLLIEVRRGIEIFLLGSLLSFFREDLPYFFFHRDQLLVDNYLYKFIWDVGILQFAGLALIILSVIKNTIFRPGIWLLMAITISIISPMLWGEASGDSDILYWINNLLWGNDQFYWSNARDVVRFPVFAWLAYPLFGMVIGVILRNPETRVLMLRSLIKPMLVVVVIVELYSISGYYDYLSFDYFRHGIVYSLWAFGMIVLWLNLAQILVSKCPSNAFFDLLYFWSKNVTTIFFIHWIWLGWGVYYFEHQSYNFKMLTMIFVLLLVLTHITLFTYLKNNKIRQSSIQFA